MSIEFITYKFRLQGYKGFLPIGSQHGAFQLWANLSDPIVRSTSKKRFSRCPNHCWGANGAHTSVASALTHSPIMLTHKQIFGELPTGVRTRLRFRSEDSVEQASLISRNSDKPTNRTPRRTIQSQAKIDKHQTLTMINSRDCLFHTYSKLVHDDCSW